MRFEAFSFGSIRIDGITYNHDVIIDRGEVHKRKKKGCATILVTLRSPLKSGSLESVVAW
jgi:hypothetical protein